MPIETKSNPASSEAASRLSLPWRLAISAVVLFHLSAVFMPPFTFATSAGPGMGSPLAEPILARLRPYVDLMYLNHGYFFFAPNPGPTHLLRARLEFADGRPAQEITLPDRERQWPRLFYHRHFMLAEHLHAEFAPAEIPNEAPDPMQEANWRRARAMYDARRTSMEAHLRAVTGAERVTLTRVEHRLMGPGEFVALQKPINAPDTYIELSEELPPGPPDLPPGPPDLPLPGLPGVRP